MVERPELDILSMEDYAGDSSISQQKGENQIETLPEETTDEDKASYQACTTIADTYMAMSGNWAGIFSGHYNLKILIRIIGIMPS